MRSPRLPPSCTGTDKRHINLQDVQILCAQLVLHSLAWAIFSGPKVLLQEWLHIVAANDVYAASLGK